MSQILQHKDEIFTVFLYVHAAALVIVNLTPTPKDNQVLGGVYRAVEFAAGFLGARAKK
ncbi:hypothetical protein [Synechococcus elongatus]|uniref:hypothetical protein n=1 Tax=Synechococcus elongatus TaxID=32046 RepID=UPI000039FF2C|nr:hypothetical protein [Synechococcus elongatus]MBD2588653.1 hypothetical protein [Synechococcus elongatus FACHB-242]MBD2689758.1 hypothetical protein [Synechococcus elongatus FACHB-1061]MBD2708365.1 hypothetical protein [Synechococcus elongatus PCC 7942 = FACHB-805]UOW70551.1 hypothetical protein PCC7943_0790 [Synechococcus elongatus PCC 7943]UOW73272.1 hypothetical protein PCC6311_0790 [Synechococcus elongatus PCC 6311]